MTFCVGCRIKTDVFKKVGKEERGVLRGDKVLGCLIIDHVQLIHDTGLFFFFLDLKN